MKLHSLLTLCGVGIFTRSNDETIEIDPAHLRFVFQGVDAEGCKAKNTAAFHGASGFSI